MSNLLNNAENIIYLYLLTCQEIDIAATAVKLAECQETIFLLGKQLQAMRNPAEPLNPSSNCRLRRRPGDLLDETDATDNLNSPGILSSRLSDEGEITARTGGESPLYHISPSYSESCGFSDKSPVNENYQKHKTNKSSSSSSSSNSLSENHGHGFSRFFSKRKNDK